MSYSVAYQTVTAGRVREDEAIAFLGQNKVSCGRVTNFKNLSAAKQPSISKDYLASESIGKTGTRVPSLDVYLSTKPQIS